MCVDDSYFGEGEGVYRCSVEMLGVRAVLLPACYTVYM